MNKRTFLVAVDAGDPNAQAQNFRLFLKDNPKVDNWWNYMPFIYLVVSSDDADAVAHSVRSRTGLNKFLVTEVNLNESEGMLPESAWNWIRTQSDGDLMTTRKTADTLSRTTQ